MPRTSEARQLRSSHRHTRPPATEVPANLRGALQETALGWLAIFGTTEAGVHDLSFGHRQRPQVEHWCHARGLLEQVAAIDKQPRWLLGAVDALMRYADGEFVDLSEIPVAIPVSSTLFQRRVLESCRRIAYGTTRSYAQLAELAGSPRAARAVGNVMRTNRVPLLIPCHRVVGAGNHLGGFSAPDGIRAKQRLLSMEASTVRER